MFFNFQSWRDVLPEELRVYINHLNFCQLKQDLKQDEKRQNVLEELHDCHNLKTYVGGYHIKTVYRQCNKAELKLNETFMWAMPARWCECKKRITDLPHKSYTRAYYRAVRKNMCDRHFGCGFRNYKEQLEMFKKHHGRQAVNYLFDTS